MAEETETADAETLPETPTPEPEPVAPDGPTPEEIAQQEREGRIRAETEARVLRETRTAPAPPSEPPPQRIFTPAEIEAARLTGRYTAEQLGYEYQRYTEHVAEQKAREAREQERAAIRARDLGARISAHLQVRPGLGQEGSPDLESVRQWIEARHGDPSDRAQQLMACDALFGVPRNGGGVANNDARRSVVLRGNGGGAPGGGTGGGKPDPLKGIPQSYVDSWVRLGLDRNDANAVQRHADRYWASRHRAGQVRPA